MPMIFDRPSVLTEEGSTLIASALLS